MVTLNSKNLLILGLSSVSMGFYSKSALSEKTENEPRSNMKSSLKLILRRLIVLMGTSKPENMSV